MRKLGIIGSMEIRPERLFDAEPDRVFQPHTGLTLYEGEVGHNPVAVLARGGTGRPLPPGAIPFRENILTLKSSGVTDVISTAMVGGLRSDLPAGSLVVLDQFLDFTRRRPTTLFSESAFGFGDFSQPFCEGLRTSWLEAAHSTGAVVHNTGCYVCVDGPRFETAAEIRMFARLGGDVIGHTLLPECVMAREAGLCYSMIAGVVNPGAGMSSRALFADDFRAPRRDNFETIYEMVDHLAREARLGEKCQCPRVPIEGVGA